MKGNRARLPLILLFGVLAVLSVVNLYLMLSKFSMIAAIIITIFIAYLIYIFTKRLIRPFGYLSKHKNKVLIGEDERLEKYNITLYKSNLYDKYESMFKPIEVFEDNDEVSVVISDSYNQRHNKKNIDILIDRELIKFFGVYQIKSFTMLFAPVMIVLNIMIVFMRNINEYREKWGSFLTDFGLPFLFLICFIGVLLIWNKYHSYIDQSIDQALTKYYSVIDICSFIEKIEQEEGGYEKEKYSKFNEMHVLKRVNKLKNRIGEE